MDRYYNISEDIVTNQNTGLRATHTSIESLDELLALEMIGGHQQSVFMMAAHEFGVKVKNKHQIMAGLKKMPNTIRYMAENIVQFPCSIGEYARVAWRSEGRAQIAENWDFDMFGALILLDYDASDESIIEIESLIKSGNNTALKKELKARGFWEDKYFIHDGNHRAIMYAVKVLREELIFQPLPVLIRSITRNNYTQLADYRELEIGVL